MLIAAYREVKMVVGIVAQRGPRPLLLWGLGFILLWLGVAFVQRFAAGNVTPADFMALGPIVVPLCQQLLQRHREVMAGQAVDSPPAWKGPKPSPPPPGPPAPEDDPGRRLNEV